MTLDELYTRLPSKEELLAWLLSQEGQTFMLYAAGVFLVLILFWAWRRHRRALENLGLARRKRELNEYFDEEAFTLVSESAESSATFTSPDFPPIGETNSEEPVVLDDVPALLPKLPFCRRAGLTTSHAERFSLNIEAVFFDPRLANEPTHDALRLLPFLPSGELLTEAPQSFNRGHLFAEPGKLIRVEGGLTVVRLLEAPLGSSATLTATPGWEWRVPTEALLTALLDALVVSHATQIPCAPVLRMSGAALFLRPNDTLVNRLLEREQSALTFIQPMLGHAKLTTERYAQLMAVALA